MEQRELGTTGLRVSALGFGCGAIGGLMVRGDPAEQRQALARALDAGITYFDTAAMYGNGQSEQNLGRTLSELGAWDRVVVGTKVRLQPSELERPQAGIRASLQASLRRLGRESVDVLHLHNPVTLLGAQDGRGEIELRLAIGGVAEGLAAVVRDGLARHAGFTGLGDPPALAEMLRDEPFETVQAYFNVLNPSAGYTGHGGGQQDFHGLIDDAARAGVGVLAIRVLAGGALSGTPARERNAGDPGPALVGGGTYASDLERAARLAPLLAEYDQLEGPFELAVRFALSKAGVSSVLVGFSTLEQLESTLRWAERGALPEELVRRVVELAA